MFYWQGVNLIEFSFWEIPKTPVGLEPTTLESLHFSSTRSPMRCPLQHRATGLASLETADTPLWLKKNPLWTFCGVMMISSLFKHLSHTHTHTLHPHSVWLVAAGCQPITEATAQCSHSLKLTSPTLNGDPEHTTTNCIWSVSNTSYEMCSSDCQWWCLHWHMGISLISFLYALSE